MSTEKEYDPESPFVDSNLSSSPVLNTPLPLNIPIRSSPPLLLWESGWWRSLFLLLLGSGWQLQGYQGNWSLRYGWEIRLIWCVLDDVFRTFRSGHGAGRAEILWSIGWVLHAERGDQEGGVGAGFGRQGVLVLQGWECPLGLVQSKIGTYCNNFKNVRIAGGEVCWSIWRFWFVICSLLNYQVMKIASGFIKVINGLPQ